MEHGLENTNNHASVTPLLTITIQSDKFKTIFTKFLQNMIVFSDKEDEGAGFADGYSILLYHHLAEVTF